MDGAFSHASKFEQKVKVHFRMQSFSFFLSCVNGKCFSYQCTFYGLDLMALFYFILYLISECNSPTVGVSLNNILSILFIFLVIVLFI